ncbi:MAG: hypothetical protein AAF478_03805 [Pseudomonadota bacterium]
MEQANFFDDYVTEAIKVLREQGITIRWGDDFDLFRRIISRHDERYAPAKGFNPDNYETSELDGIWLVAYRGSGELVHTQACRRVSVRPGMSKHLQTEANAYEPEYLSFDLDNLEVNLSPDAAKIKGDAVYHGEAWLKGGPDGIRGGSALSIFSRMMIAKALSHWDVEYIFGLITPFTGIKGLPQRYGYSRCEQGTMRFLDQAELPNDIWLVWMTSEEARSQLRLTPRYFAEFLSPSEKAPVEKVA